MWQWVLVLLVGVVFAAIATWMTRRILDAMVGWARGLAVGTVGFLLSLPLALWALRAADVIEGDRLTVSGPLAWLFLVVTVGWVFALVVAALVTFEILWPTRDGWHPITGVREMLRRRARTKRYAEILAIASRHGLGELRRRGRSPLEDDDQLPAALVAAMNEAGVTFVKIGQVLSTRDDILPTRLTDAFATLQMDSTPLPWPDVKVAIESELKRPLGEVFARVDEEPLAAASLAQVHRAVLLDGAQVVVKVERPTARQQVSVDLDIVERLAADAEARTEWGRSYGASALAAEFARALREELDYRVEVSNTELMRQTLARSESDALSVPILYPDLCTSRLIVMEYVDGVPFSRIHGVLAEQPEGTAERLADAVLDSVFEQIAVRGVFHADLHPGNILLRADGTVTLIDFGAIGIIEKSMRRLMVALLVAIANEDDVAVTDLVLMLIERPDDLDVVALQHELGVMITRVHNSTADEMLFTQLVGVLREHHLAIPPALLLVLRTLGSLEGTLRHLVPDYDLAKHGLSRAAHFALHMTTPKEALVTAQTQLVIVGEQLRRLPRRIETVSTALERGTFSMRLRLFESAGDRAWLDSLFGRVTTTAIGLVLVVVSILLLVSDQGPLLTADVPLYPFIGAIVGLGGFLLVLRGLRAAFERRRS